MKRKLFTEDSDKSVESKIESEGSRDSKDTKSTILPKG
jgi:hypothetical protein